MSTARPTVRYPRPVDRIEVTSTTCIKAVASRVYMLWYLLAKLRRISRKKMTPPIARGTSYSQWPDGFRPRRCGAEDC